MTSNFQNAFGSNSVSIPEPPAGLDTGEATLRLLAQLPAPEGLEERVLAGVHTGGPSGSVLSWPRALQPSAGWVRAAAAAAIVFVVVGGGWGIYSHVEPLRPDRMGVMPARTGTGGGFSNAGAMRTPQTLNGPVVAHPAEAQQAPVKPARKVAARVAPLAQPAHAVAARKASAQPSVSVAR